MKRLLTTLLFASFLLLPLRANAVISTFPLTNGNYYYLQTTVGDAPATSMYLSMKGGSDSLILIAGTSPLFESDSALWKVEYETVNTTGSYTYLFTNKASKKVLSFADSDMKNGTGKNKLTGSMRFAFQQMNPNSDDDTQSSILYSYRSDLNAILFLALDDKGRIIPKAADKMPLPDGALKFTFVRPLPRYLSAAELNEKENGKGFQLFGYFNGLEVMENNPLLGILFWADGKKGDGSDKAVTLRAVQLNQKKDGNGQPRDQYAYLDTLSYSAASNLPTDGARMLFRVDTIPTDGAKFVISGNNTDSCKFAFLIDPSAGKDSVCVFVNQKINPAATDATPPHTFKALTSAVVDLGNTLAADWIPLQIDKLAGTSVDRYVLTTGLEGQFPFEPTRIAFEGDPIPGLLPLDKVYAVKNVNKAEGFKSIYGGVTAGEYYGVDLSNTEAALEAAYRQVPATQFVYDGKNLVNREKGSFNLGRINKIGDGVYANTTDTFEVTALDVKKDDMRVGYKYFSTTDQANRTYTFNYISGILNGRSLNTTTDSFLIAAKSAGLTFKVSVLKDNSSKIVEKTFGAETVKDGVTGLSRQAYKITSRDGKLVIAQNTKGQLVTKLATSVGDAIVYFYFRETELAGQYILVPATSGSTLQELEYSYKYNVNSTSGIMERVTIHHDNNVFAITDQFGSNYVLESQGHYTLKTQRGEGLTPLSNLFATFRRAGELKATYTEDDLKLYLDTASVYGNETQPLFYLLKGAAVGKDGLLEGNFLRVREDVKDKEGYYVKVGSENMPRLQFVAAKREAKGDSLLLKAEDKPVATDSINYRTADGKSRKNGQAIEQFRFRFKYVPTGTYVKLESELGSDRFVAILNDIVYLTKNEDSAVFLQLVSVKAPTANEEAVEAAFTTYTSNGAVIIKGAAGKTVSITNVLGQTITTKIVATDYETIPAPTGVVFVTVNGETVKTYVNRP